MFASTLLVAVTALAGLASAQNYSTTGGNLTITVSQVPLSERNDWCTAQRNTCPAICDGSTQINTCDPNTLLWDCKCLNGNTPNVSSYQQSMPAYICRQWVANCVDGHPNDATGQANCQAVICGNMSEIASTTSSAAMTTSMSTLTLSSSAPASTAASATTSAASAAASTGAAVAYHVAENYGVHIVGSMLLAVFGLAL